MSWIPEGSESRLVRVDPQSVRFTQKDIADHFSEPHEDVDLYDAVRRMNAKLLTPSDFPPIEVWKDEDGILWSFDNRRLWVFRKADGVNSVEAKFLSNGTKFRFRIKGDRETLIDAHFFPRIRGGNKCDEPVRWGPSSSNNSNVGNVSFQEEESQSSLPGLLVSASAALIMGFASWKLFNRTKSDK